MKIINLCAHIRTTRKQNVVFDINNPGSEKMASHLAKSSKPNIPLFLNVGKSKITTLEDAHLDYATTVSRCEPYVDGFVINVSSPDTYNRRSAKILW